MKNYSFYVWLHHKLKRKGTLEILDKLRKSQWHSTELIEEYQLDMLKDIILYAKANTVYYRESLSRIGLADARDIKSIRDITKIAILTKNDVRDNLDILTAKRNDLVENQTGGSTGIPLSFFNDKKFIDEHKPAAMYRAYAMAGYKVGDKMGIVWGYDNDIPKLTILKRMIKGSIYKYYELNSFALSEDKIRCFIQTIAREKPRYLKGYANSLAEIARFILQNNISIQFDIKAIFSEAERLDEFKRELIEKAFRTKVHNLYGSREFGVIAIECPEHDGLHINFEQLYVEITNEGKILITSFLNRGTVFIRYQIGDYADWIVNERCPCKRDSARLHKILGRESDNFVTKDGSLVHGEYVTHLFYGTASIRQFQVIQESYCNFQINVVSDDPHQAAIELEMIKSKLQSHFKSPVYFQCRFVADLDKTVSGKYKFTICNVKQ